MSECTCADEDGMAVYSPSCPNAYHRERAARRSVALLEQFVKVEEVVSLRGGDDSFAFVKAYEDDD